MNCLQYACSSWVSSARLKPPHILNLPFLMMQALYELVAVDNHSGSMSFGHYTAYLKHPITKKWYDCNGRWPRGSHFLAGYFVVESWSNSSNSVANADKVLIRLFPSNHALTPHSRARCAARNEMRIIHFTSSFLCYFARCSVQIQACKPTGPKSHDWLPFPPEYQTVPNLAA